MYHLGCLKRGFESRELEEGMVENADETHFVFNMDNGRTLGLKGDEHVKYADVVSGDEGITMMVNIMGGIHARLRRRCSFFRIRTLRTRSAVSQTMCLVSVTEAGRKGGWIIGFLWNGFVNHEP